MTMKDKKGISLKELCIFMLATHKVVLSWGAGQHSPAALAPRQARATAD